MTDMLPFGVGARIEEAAPEEGKEGGGGFLGALGLKKKSAKVGGEEGWEGGGLSVLLVV